MANLDLMSYERDSRWMPHLSWAYPDLTLQQRMEQQAAQREQAWQKIADKLGPLLIGSDIGGSYGQSDYISRDICEDQDYLERVYEKAPLLSSAKYPSSTIRSQRHSTNSSNNNLTRSTNYNSNTNTNNLISQQQDLQHQRPVASHQQHQTRTNKSNQQHSSQKHNNLNLYAQNHLVQMPQRGHPNHMKHNSSYHDSGSQLSMLLTVLLFMLLLLLFSLLLFFFYFNH